MKSADTIINDLDYNLRHNKLSLFTFIFTSFVQICIDMRSCNKDFSIYDLYASLEINTTLSIIYSQWHSQLKKIYIGILSSLPRKSRYFQAKKFQVHLLLY